MLANVFSILQRERFFYEKSIVSKSILPKVRFVLGAKPRFQKKGEKLERTISRERPSPCTLSVCQLWGYGAETRVCSVFLEAHKSDGGDNCKFTSETAGKRPLLKMAGLFSSKQAPQTQTDNQRRPRKEEREQR